MSVGIAYSTVPVRQLAISCVNVGELLHDVPAEHADANHESPARDLRESKDSVGNGDVEIVFGKIPIEWMKSAFIYRDLLIRLLTVDPDNLLGGGGRRVERDDMNRRSWS